MARRILPLLTLLLAACTSVSAVLADPLADDRLAPGLYPAAPAPAPPPEPAHLPIELDWSLGLKGGYTASTDGNGFVTTLTPAFTATHQGVRTDMVLGGEANLARGNDGTLGVTSANLALDASTRLDSDTILTGTAGLRFSQELPGTPGLNAAIIDPPANVAASIGGGVARRFGQFNLDLNANLERTIYGTTNRTDTGITDNSHQNVWEGDTSLRLGLQATPIIEVFGLASLGRDWFDGAPTGGARTDATSRALRAGLAGNWNGVWAASASLGVGQHDFDDPGLADITTQLYDASLTYSPASTLDLRASLSTEISPTGADTAGTARVTHTIAASASYTVNSWLRLRASADWSHSSLEGTGDTEHRHGIGAGADYRVNSRTAISADYDYGHRDNSATGSVDSHTLSLGVTVKR